jgi:hypothetical protein
MAQSVLPLQLDKSFVLKDYKWIWGLLWAANE